MDNHRHWVMGSPGTLADGYGRRRHNRWWLPWLEHNPEPWAPKAPLPLEDQPLTSTAAATRATHNLCMDEGGWWIWLDRRAPAYGIRTGRTRHCGGYLPSPRITCTMIRRGNILQPRVAVA